MSEIINIRKNKGKEKFVYIGRVANSRCYFGNPFVMGRDGSRDQVCDKHIAWLDGTDFKDFRQKQRKWVLENLWRLKGENLGCFCAPKRCHGLYLMEIANQ